MRAHEKWLYKNYGKCSKNLSFRYGSRMGWKAALKWALSQETDLQQTELGDAIRKELESKK